MGRLGCRSETSRQVDLAAEQTSLDGLTRPSVQKSKWVDMAAAAEKSTPVDWSVGAEKLYGLNWMPEPCRLDWLTRLPEPRSLNGST